MKNHNNKLITFLIVCCKDNLTKQDIDFISDSIQSQVSYQEVISTALKHGILPIIYKSLTNIEQIPQEFLKQLKLRYIQIVQKNMQMSAELIRVVTILEKHDINYISFKGPALSMLAYGDITLRQYGDLDILVKQNDVYKVAQLLYDNNYISEYKLNFFQNQKLLDISSDLALINNKNHIYIELHWKLFRKKFNNTKNDLYIWDTLDVVNLNHKKIMTLNIELLLVYLCIHGSKHMWERIEWILDIDRLISSNQIDWDEVLRYIDKMHNINALLLGLSLANKLFNTNIPHNRVSMRKQQKDTLGDLENYTLNLLVTSRYTMFDKFRYHAKLSNSKFSSIRYYLSTIIQPTPDDIFVVDLPKYLSFLYFIIRPFRIMIKYLL